jgi:uncharacterized membrane protein
MELTLIDWVKIGVTIFSCLSLWYFRRRIIKTITDFIIGEDSATYQDKSVVEIMKGVDEQLKEVLR